MGLNSRTRRPASPSYMIGGIVATLLMHGAIVVAVWIGHAREGDHVDVKPVGHFVEVQAVRFGKPRDLSFLPHKEAPVIKPKPKLQLTDNADAAPNLKKPEKEEKPVEDPLKRTSLADIRRLAESENATGTAEAEGDPNGMKGGSATVGKGPLYYQHLQSAITNAWNVPPSISDAQLARLKAMACMKLDTEGNILEFSLMTKSGNDRFDATLLDALGGIKKFDPPTADVKAEVTGDGVCINFAKTRE